MSTNIADHLGKVKSLSELSFADVQPFIALDAKRGRDNRILLTSNSFYWFNLIYLSHIFDVKPAPFQVESYDLAISEEAMLIMWPRGYGKSVTWCIGYPLWMGLTNPYRVDRRRKPEELYMISHAQQLMLDRIKEQKVELKKNKLIINDFEPDEGEAWTREHYNVSFNGMEQYRVVGKGMGAQIRGDHPHEILVDDLEDRKEAKNEAIREETRQYVFRDLYGSIRKYSWGRTRWKFIGTPVAYNAVICQLEKLDWFTVKKYPILDAFNKPLWEAYQNYDELMEEKGKLMMIDPGAWYSEKMLQPPANENPIFPPQWLKGRYNSASEKFEALVKAGLYTAVGNDPAASTKTKADYTGIVAVSTDGRDFFIRHIYRQHLPPDVIVSKTASICREFEATACVIEVVQFQELLYKLFEDYMEENHYYIDAKRSRKTRGNDKVMHAGRIVRLFRKGRVYFDDNDPMTSRLIDEMEVFPDGDHDDMVDAMVMALNDCMEWVDRYEDEEGDEPFILDSGTYNEYTGVRY